MRTLRRRTQLSEKSKPVFSYQSAHGSSGYQPFRMKTIIPPIAPGEVVERIEIALHGQSERTFIDPDGAILTLAPLRAAYGFAMPFTYGLVFEIPKRNIYAVFYISALGEVCWVAGPKSHTFPVVWKHLCQHLSKELH